MSPWQQQLECNIRSLGLTADTVKALLSDYSETHSVPNFKLRGTEQFHRHLNHFIDTLPGLRAIYKSPSDPRIQACCDIIFQHPRLLQQLHLLEQLLPTNYYNALFSALAGFAIAEEVKLDDDSIELTLLGGLYHDIGFLCYPMTPLIEHPNENCIDDPAIKAHAAVGAGMVKRLSRAPLVLCDIIRNHHERAHRTGYSSSTNPATHTVIAIIAVTDLIVRASREYSHYPQHKHQLTRCILQLRTHEFPSDIHRAAINLTKHEVDVSTPPSNQPRAINLTQQGQAIAHCNMDLNRSLNLLIQNQPSAQNLALKKLQEQLQMGINNIGIELPEYAASTEALESKDSLELINLNVFQNEICHQMGRLRATLKERAEQLHSHEKSLKIQLTDILEHTKLPNLVHPPIANTQN